MADVYELISATRGMMIGISLFFDSSFWYIQVTYGSVMVFDPYESHLKVLPAVVCPSVCLVWQKH